jgi:predicted phage terminase large subunit-like protein
VTLPAELRAEVDALPPEGKQILLARWAARRAAKDPAGPIPGHRKWPTPGAMARDLDPTTRQTPALDLLDDELVKVADGETRRLAFYMPPQEGKSQRVSRRFVTWLLSIDPTLRVVIVSFEKGRAERWGRWAKQDVETFPRLGIRLREDSRASGRWATLEGGGVYTVGLPRGALAGEPADVLIIDDPVKDRQAAESALLREATWDWWESVGQARLSARGRVVLIMTHWHHDDLGARLDFREPGLWRTIRVPAVAEDDDDPLGRNPGEELASAQGREPGYFHALRERLAPYVWQSIYQQRPTPAGGNMFRTLDWRYWRTGPGGARLGGQVLLGERNVWLADTWRFITVDLAASVRTSADWTVASVWGHHFATGDLLLLDRVRVRVVEDDHAALLLPLTQKWAADTVWIERSFISSTLVRDLTRAGVKTTPLDPDTDKVTRAVPYANRVKAHGIWLPSGAPWLDEWETEHAQFPNGPHDDQVDTGAYATRVVATRWNPAGVPSDLMTPPPSALDEDAPGFDYEGQQW